MKIEIPMPTSNKALTEAPSIRKLPLVVDLDGTLTTTDTLMESIIRAIKRKPGTLLRMPLWLAGGRASFKAKVAEHADFRADALPYRESLIAYLAHERESGRKIVLATAAHRSIAERVSRHLGLFDLVISTAAKRTSRARPSWPASVNRWAATLSTQATARPTCRYGQARMAPFLPA
ncbi:haloacid dehalogenase-like hydrolase [Burkholderia gladioli]|uniref:haloacid dehalogenase-like hydrolase n=1 Tax=Burkholderia gladioli TaxID=28095 RepID=UPI001FC7E158|nr:haloacid dehalogenase-like hydrolase [Burkholderia gladioli]